MSKKILGLDLGSNSVGWALLSEDKGDVNGIIGLGSRIFQKAVEDKVPTPKNVSRRDKRLGRRVLQRRARRRQRMLNYLVSLDLLPTELQNHHQPEILLNAIGNPYELRAKALDFQLKPYELGRILLHFTARRGFLSSKKQISGDLIDDPDTQAYLAELDDKPSTNKEETAFKIDIQELRLAIEEAGYRTLGEHLFHLDQGQCKRNRSHAGGHLRIDRQMYNDELNLIWKTQQTDFSHLPDDFMLDKQGIKKIIFYQRPLKLKKDRIGKCSLEPNKNRAATARLEVQKFRYLQDINNLQYFERETEQWQKITTEAKQQLVELFEHNEKLTITKLKKVVGLDKSQKLNLDAKNLKGNITACEIRKIIGVLWDEFNLEKQKKLVEDMLSIQSKATLKRRLNSHWGFSKEASIALALVEFEPSHSNHSLKAINKLLPFLEQGLVYSDARIEAGYDYEVKKQKPTDILGAPPETANPIVNRGLYELKRVINAIIKHYGKPDAIRIEMARDLEMNTKRYKENEKRQNVRFERSVAVKSSQLGITGKLDLLEIEGKPAIKYFPVEYKRGKPKIEDWDKIQLCAQALCLEEMRDISIDEGALWYWKVRKREPVLFDEALRKTTLAAIEGAHKLLASGKTPAPTENKKRCRACSLVDLCEPDTFRRDHSGTYIKELFKETTGSNTDEK